MPKGLVIFLCVLLGIYILLGLWFFPHPIPMRFDFVGVENALRLAVSTYCRSSDSSPHDTNHSGLMKGTCTQISKLRTHVLVNSRFPRTNVA